MDDASGELMESTGEVLRRGLGESELDRLVSAWLTKSSSRFQKRGSAVNVQSGVVLSWSARYE